MRITSPIAILLLSPIALSACVSSIKPEAKQLDFYDFGLQSATQRVTFNLPVAELNASNAIQHSNIRYRLNYKNPAQIFSYAESRWSTLPVDLVRQKIDKTNASKSSCSLKLQIVAFDQVFDTADSSHGIVQLQASIIENRSRQRISTTLISAQSTAGSADAKGGVNALDTASTAALQQAADWASATSAAADCQPSS
ncbi:phospholipid/cholesterol/gamma-HCH transport system substrate-binding protein/cholesterol transport system auxiliary component [Methylobacillus rhizosphaerae]|uniref:Phospholipid/cholesterol/gamma-HCH transport system substrate-binding protein/cholesterol transport system auxiliary component n=1 Tax=Methylobacillus rhizosphaerae TaxID=551994 RepID=A0A238XTW9_9PROT|nr:hypothetical protein [Methylobacillus rhizosphaerae]SNR62357.1 phospholipid/cholesterol/gamma-HCH transport system substrate-binding protein/cholesterol transport system auxiliary component [Methylobacillus rhizosphaerae]